MIDSDEKFSYGTQNLCSLEEMIIMNDTLALGHMNIGGQQGQVPNIFGGGQNFLVPLALSILYPLLLYPLAALPQGYETCSVSFAAQKSATLTLATTPELII